MEFTLLLHWAPREPANVSSIDTNCGPNLVTSPGWRVKYDGLCSRCGLSLRRGDSAVYERTTRTIHCVVCPPAGVIHAPESVVDVGVAGASARREYVRRKLSRETRIKGRFGDRLGRVVLAVTDEPQSTRAWATGARGEEKLAEALEGIEGLRALHDRRVAGTRRNIDHILIGPAGVFVVDAKLYQGAIAIRNRGWFLRPDYRLYVGRRDCSDLAAGLSWQMDAVVAALVAADVDPIPTVTPVLCFVDGEWPLFRAPESYHGVRLEGPRSIRKAVTMPAILESAEVDRLTEIIATALLPK